MLNLKNFRKFINWEYWPSFMFYGPNFPYGVYLAIKARSFAFFSAVNPGIKSSGNGTESKFETLQMIPDEFKPKSIFVPEKHDFKTVLKEINDKGIVFPLIAKPDVGFRGYFVKKINNENELKEYLSYHSFDLIIQDFIDLPNECGVFYYRLPHQEKGQVSSLTLKSFLKVTGNGLMSVEELVLHDKRAKHYIKRLYANNKNIWNKVLIKDETVILSEIGNHVRATQFINASNLIDAALEQTFNDLSNKIPGLFYGRYDIKYNTLEELKQGKNFKFLEVNGIIAEPIQIYDTKSMTYFEALRTLRKHWKILYQIAIENHKKGVPYMGTMVFWKEIYDLMQYIKKIKKLSPLEN